MTAKPVEWVLVIFYGKTVHRATYGRFCGDTKYTKDYIQLHRQSKFLNDLKSVFPQLSKDGPAIDLNYQWPSGTASGKLVPQSADRPHMSWETKFGAPPPWRMALAPDLTTAQTIPGNPDHQNVKDAEREFEKVVKECGQPYLMAIKLKGESNTLHLRSYLENAATKFAWADTNHLPAEVLKLISRANPWSNLAWSLFNANGRPLAEEVLKLLAVIEEEGIKSFDFAQLEINSIFALRSYLESPPTGLFFDSEKKHDAWLDASTTPAIDESNKRVLQALIEAELTKRSQSSDAVSETLDTSNELVEVFTKQLENQNYTVPDTLAEVKTRGSAQRVFAEAVKKNYGGRCAVTGIETRDFLVAAHIVPWSVDETIRLDPSNGICLSLIIDRAFERGHLTIEGDLTIVIDWEKVGDDIELQNLLKPYDKNKLAEPSRSPPKSEYLERRRALVDEQK